MGETRYTEKEMVMAKRDAARAMVSELRARNLMLPLGPEWPGSMVIAAELFPLPKVERPRVVTDEWSHAWRVIGDVIEVRYNNGEWGSTYGFKFNKERILILADLFAHPSELVDDEG